MSAIVSFLGGSVFRMMFGWFSSWWDKKVDHQYELERMRLQADMDDKQHIRNQEAIRLQAELGVKTIQVQGEIDLEKIDAAGFYDAVKEATKPTGIKLVDTWNGIIRPLAASIALWLWVVALNANGWHMTDWDKELVGVILGFFFASRMMQQNGK